MANYLLKFGNYVFPAIFAPQSVPSESRLTTVEVPRRDGVLVSEQRLAAKSIQIKGMLRSSTPDGLRNAMDSLLAAVNNGRQKLYLWDDRFIYATKNGFTTDYDETSFKRYCFVSIDFLCDTALWEAETESTDTWLTPVSGGIRDVIIGGNAPVRPVFEFTVSGTGDLNIQLAVGSSYFTLQGPVVDGDVVVVDCAEESCEMSGVSDYDYMGWFDSIFVELAGGGYNRLAFTDNGGTATVPQIVMRWRDRWY